MKKLLTKDLKLELKSLNSILVFIYLILILTFISAIGLNIAVLPSDAKVKIVPILNYLIFCFTSNYILSRSFEPEFNNSAIINLKLSGISNFKILLSKFIIYFAVLFAGSITCLFLLCFFNSLLSMINLPYILILGTVVFIYTINGLIFSALFQNEKMKSVFIPIINLPISLPIFLAGLSLSYSTIYNKEIFGDPWLNLLWICLVLYSFLAIKLSNYLFSYENS